VQAKLFAAPIRWAQIRQDLSGMIVSGHPGRLVQGHSVEQCKVNQGIFANSQGRDIAFGDPSLDDAFRITGELGKADSGHDGKGQRSWQLSNKLTWFVGCVHNRFPLSYDYRTALHVYIHIEIYSF